MSAGRLGTAVPMPLPIKSRRYDDRFSAELLGKGSSGSKPQEPDQSQRLRELGFWPALGTLQPQSARLPKEDCHARLRSPSAKEK